VLKFNINDKANEMKWHFFFLICCYTPTCFSATSSKEHKTSLYEDMSESEELVWNGVSNYQKPKRSISHGGSLFCRFFNFSFCAYSQFYIN